jgi:hypothetical protein
MYGIYNFFIIHIYTALFAIIVFLLYRLLIKSRIIIRIGFAIFLIFAVIAIIEFITNCNISNHYAYSALSILAIFFSLALFFQMINDLSIQSFRSNGLFWINSAFLFYFGTTFCLTLFEAYIHSENSDLLMQVWPIQLLSNIVFYFMLSRGIWLINRA